MTFPESSNHEFGFGKSFAHFWNGAELVMEVVSENDPRRDRVAKRVEYARAGIPEYWIVDPIRSTISVLRLSGRRYTVHGEFSLGQEADSPLLPEFKVDVSAVFAQGSELTE